MKPKRLSSLGFTLIELLVVVSIISLLLLILVPALGRARSLAREKVCASNLRQVGLALMMYAGDDPFGRYPVEPTEHNPHPQLLELLGGYQNDLIEAMYCPQTVDMEEYAASPDYIPVGDTDSIIGSEENRLAGNISYVYWSFENNKYCPTATGSENKKHWRNPMYFIPRQLYATHAKAIYEDRPLIKALPTEIWVLTDFFRRGAPFPHVRKHANGLDVCYLDGHVELIRGKPRDNYR